MEKTIGRQRRRAWRTAVNRKPPAGGAARARLDVLAAGDETKFREVAAEMLASKQRLDREAALDALMKRPVPDLRPALRDLFFELSTDGIKRDQGARQRIAVVSRPVVHVNSTKRTLRWTGKMRRRLSSPVISSTSA